MRGKKDFTAVIKDLKVGAYPALSDGPGAAARALVPGRKEHQRERGAGVRSEVEVQRQR